MKQLFNQIMSCNKIVILTEVIVKRIVFSLVIIQAVALVSAAEPKKPIVINLKGEQVVFPRNTHGYPSSYGEMVSRGTCILFGIPYPARNGAPASPTREMSVRRPDLQVFPDGPYVFSTQVYSSSAAVSLAQPAVSNRSESSALDRTAQYSQSAVRKQHTKTKKRVMFQARSLNPADILSVPTSPVSSTTVSSQSPRTKATVSLLLFAQLGNNDASESN